MEVKPGFKQTEVGVIPEDWPIVLLDSVARRGSGHTPDKAHPEYWDGHVKWVSLQDCDKLDRLYIYDTAVKITSAGIANSSARMHPVGTVVMSRDAGVGKTAIISEDMAVSQHFMAWTCGQHLDNRYLYYWLYSQKSEFERIAIGNTIKTIGVPYFKQLRIPLPAKSEQKSVADALTDADALIGSLEQLLTKKHQIKQGTMQELLTGMRRLPGFSTPWALKRISDLATLSKVVSNPAATPDVSFIHFSIPAFDSERQPKIEKGKSIGSHKFIVPPGAVLLSKLNPRIPRIWAPAHVPPNSVCSTEFLALVPKVSVDRDFLACVCCSKAVAGQMELHAIGTTGSHQRIAPAQALAIEVNVPNSQTEQTAIARILSDMDAEITTLEAKLAKTRALKQGMMQQLLTGKIRLI